MILLAGCLLQGRAVHRLLNLCAALLAFGAITAIEFKLTGLELLPVIQDYELAAHARLTYSFMDLVRGVVFSGRLVGSVTLLVLFAISRRPGEPPLDFRCIGLIIGTYAACQYALNMTNNWDPNMWLAPAAVTSLAGCIDVKPAAQQAGGSESWWRRFPRSGLAEISAREAIPLLHLRAHFGSANYAFNNWNHGRCPGFARNQDALRCDGGKRCEFYVMVTCTSSWTTGEQRSCRDCFSKPWS